MTTEQAAYSMEWSIDLPESLWFSIGNFLTINDIHRLSRTCSHLHKMFTSNDFWSSLIRKQFGYRIWQRLVKNASLAIDYEPSPTTDSQPCRSKLIYFELIKRKRISFSDLDRFSFDTNRNYLTVPDSSSLNGRVLCLKDSIELCYSLQIETVLKNLLPGKYDVIWRMKLDIPYMFGVTEFFAAPEQNHPGQVAYLRWTQNDFLSMYRCFNCAVTDTNLWFYQTIGSVEITGDQPCNVYISMINQDAVHAKHGVYLDYVELKLRRE